MSDALTQGKDQARNQAEESLFLLETLRVLLSREAFRESMFQTLQDIEHLTTKESLNASLTPEISRQAAEMAKRLDWDVSDLVEDSTTKQEAWVEFVGSMLSQGLFRTVSLYEAAAQVWALKIDMILSFGRVASDGSLVSQGNTVLHKIWEKRIPAELRNSRKPEQRLYILGTGKMGMWIYFY